MESMGAEDGETVEPAEGVHLTQLTAGERISVQHYHIEPGARVPEHSHGHEQAGYLAQGTLTFLVEGEKRVVRSGQSYTIPSHEPHAAENRSDVPAVGVDLFSPPRPEPPQVE